MSDWHELQSKLAEKNTKMDDAQLELIAAAVHADWVEGKHAQGVTSRCGPDGEEYMVPYAQLSEAAKELDRATVWAVLKHLPAAALAPAPAASSGAEAGVWEEVRIPVGRLWQQINDHQEKARRADRRYGEVTDPVIVAYWTTVAALHTEFATELLGLLPSAPAPAGAE